MDKIVVANGVPLLLVGESLEYLGALWRQVHLDEHLVEPAFQLLLRGHRRPTPHTGAFLSFNLIRIFRLITAFLSSTVQQVTVHVA